MTKKTTKKTSNAGSSQKSEDQIKSDAVAEYKLKIETEKKAKEKEKAEKKEKSKETWLSETDKVDKCDLVGRCYRESTHPGHKWVMNKTYPCIKSPRGNDQFLMTIYVDYQVMTYRRDKITKEEEEAGYIKKVNEYVYSEKQFRKYFKLEK